MNNWTDPRVTEWGRKHFAESPISGVWSPDGTGLIFLKTDEKKWTLVRAVNHEATIDTLSGIRTLMFDLGYALDETDTEWDEAPKTMEEAAEIESSQKQDIANSWADEDGTKLKDMNPHETFPLYVKDNEVLLENGDTEVIEVWAYPLLNFKTGNTVDIDPDDYRLLTDDKHFMRYMNKEGVIIQALTRREMMEMGNAQDPDNLGVLIGSIDPDTGEKVPPWLWGTYCQRINEALIGVKMIVAAQEEE